MAKNKSTKDVLLEHSIAKVKLFEHYLSIYLNILDRVNFIKNIIIADLFAGEGIYRDGEKGSSIKAFEAIQRHLKSKQNPKKIIFIINDPEKSEIESNKYKIQRIKEWIDNSILHPDLTIKYSRKVFSKLMPDILMQINSMTPNDRALLFIDPWGYKEIRPTDLKNLISKENVEILLFLPISFMYRFSKTAIQKGFTGSEPLESFLEEIFGADKQSIIDIHNIEEFIDLIREKFKEYLRVTYVNYYILMTEDGNTYCVYFFSFNKKGYQKMIEAKWHLDDNYGIGMNREQNLNLFSGANYDNYGEKLRSFLLNSRGRTNEELHDFGYDQGFLPKHTKEVLDRLKSEDKIIVDSIDGLPAKSFYIGNNERKVLIKKK